MGVLLAGRLVADATSPRFWTRFLHSVLSYRTPLYSSGLITSPLSSLG